MLLKQRDEIQALSVERPAPQEGTEVPTWCAKHSQYAHDCTDCGKQTVERPAVAEAFVIDEVQERNIQRDIRHTPERGEGSGGWPMSVRYLLRALNAARAVERSASPAISVIRTPLSPELRATIAENIEIGRRAAKRTKP